ncbi:MULTISPECIES: isoprenylcysteine carboxylmethyltransferase family protein [unclassified Pseudovibrio]|uniref:isoprenylcysteine carboxyl methyltransferase family protein n=1 Tax=unclassified Pseudovibrio TaxID=2627060 RepID=UPI0007AE62AE|nr:MULTISPECIES: isoprenylcysteine carboxylmethyltransferase family protein [unclassified Pseudovibrio]KZL03813.1 Isoprenylcysteine carboxyl methyltransferase (ICMT) family protein [Pseudovibrio sp. W74]KZL09792.1 Isoprenylcysteine carboxyl methyltransferase (ICMT) family protein [Pseudovibrio sp. Ad14]
MPEASLLAVIFLAFIVIQRLSELVIARSNTRRLLAAGAYEVGASHYPLIVSVHVAWIIALIVLGYDKPVSMPWLLVFVVLQVFRLWILLSMGRRWTTRIIVAKTPLVTKGPFAFVRHPNYLLVALEIFTAPMVLGLFPIAFLFSGFNGALLALRIRVEDEALTELR